MTIIYLQYTPGDVPMHSSATDLQRLWVIDAAQRVPSTASCSMVCVLLSTLTLHGLGSMQRQPWCLGRQERLFS